jgi:hypothetical protein
MLLPSFVPEPHISGSLPGQCFQGCHKHILRDQVLRLKVRKEQARGNGVKYAYKLHWSHRESFRPYHFHRSLASVYSNYSVPSDVPVRPFATVLPKMCYFV